MAVAVDIAGSVVGKILEYLVAPIGRQFGYLFCYNRNIENMRSQVEKIKDKRHGVQGEVDAAIRNCETVKADVTTWLTSVDSNEVAAQKILEDKEKVGKGCLNGWCLNIKSRYLLSRKASKKTQNLAELLDEGKFERVAHPPTPIAIVHTPQMVVETPVGGFESRSLIMRDLMTAIKGDKARTIGLWGMGGVGKTTMANEVIKRVRKDGIFDEFVMVAVGQKPDLEKVQGDIAKSLGLRLEEQSLFERASRLQSRLTQKGPNNKPKKILIILDDVWTSLDLEKVGIIFANDHNICKILLTSREKDVCDQMRTDKTYPINVLEMEEARNLFLKIARIPPGPTDLFSIAEDILKECGGLPLAITTIARVLANKCIPAWKKVLRQLKASALEGEYAVVYATLQVSYDFLQTTEIKKCFLLCCLFPEDFDIPIEDLVRFGAGIKMFSNISKLHEAREDAHADVEKLRNSNLLLESSVIDCVKTHDLVRDFALSIAKGQFLVRLGNGIEEWPIEDMYEKYTSISLQCNEMDELPDGLKYPNLTLMQLVGLDYELLKFPESFFEGMRRLQVLVLRCMSIQSLPGSLQFLTNLRTLSLNNCRLEGDISMIEKLEVLEILSFAHSEMQDLPIEIGKLSRLRLLDLTGSSKLQRIPPCLLSSLIHLEELYLRGTSICWAEQIHANPSIDDDGGGKMSASFAELKVLSKLLVIEIDIPYEVLPVDLIFLEKVKKFYVCVGCTYEIDVKHVFQNTLCCMVDKSVVLEGVFHVLGKKTEVLYLKVKDLKNLQKEIEREELLKVRDLELRSCDEMVSLVNTVGRQTTNVFQNLESLCLYDMSKLKRIFPLSIASGLINLKRLKVVRCQAIEELFTKERGGEDTEAARTFVFPRIESLHLEDLPSLIGFCKAMDEIELPQLEVMELLRLPKITSIYSKTEDLAAECQHASSEHRLFNGKVKLNKMARFKLQRMENLREIWLTHNLRELIVQNCDRLANIFSSSIAIGLVMLERLTIDGSQMMEAIFWKERGEDGAAAAAVAKIQLPHLKYLRLESLPNLTHFCKSFEEVEFPRLEKVYLDKLPKLDGLASKGHLFNKKDLQNLQDLYVESCGSVEVIFDLQQSNVNEGGHELAVLTRLKYVTLIGLNNLRHVWTNCPHVIQGSSLQNLSSLSVYDCGCLRHVFTPSIAKVLVGLQTLQVDKCKNLEAIVAKEEEEEERMVGGGGIILFPQLTALYLDNLPKLLNMISKPYTFNWPSLKKLTMGDCAKLIERLNDTLQAKSRELVDVPAKPMIEAGRKHDRSWGYYDQSWGVLPEDNLHHDRSWNSMIDHASGNSLNQHFVTSNNMETQQVREIHNLTTSFPTNVLTQLQNLEELAIRRCSSLEVVFDLQGLNVIQLAGAFQYLSSLTINRCGSLRHVFTPSIAKLLSRLQTLGISNCENLEAVVAKEEEGGYIVEGGAGGGIFILFPQLTILTLRELPKLLKLTPKTCTFNWSSLKKLNLVDCGNLAETMYSTLQVISNNMETQQVREICNLTASFPTSVLTQLQNFKELAIQRCSSLEVVFDLQGLNVIQLAGAFQYLSSLTVDGCGSLRHVFTPSIAKLLYQLQTLGIFNCENLEAVVAKEGEEEGYIVEGGAGRGIFNLFPQLTRLSLKKLPKLLQITPGAYTFNWPSLKDLTLADCGKLTETLYDTIQVALVNIETLEVHKLDNNTVFFPTSVLPQLQRLKRLQIQKCCSLEVVFNLQGFNVNNEGGYELIGPLLTQLWRINLHSLPKLRHVWKTGAHVIQGSFKNLCLLHVVHCDSLKHVFTPSVAKLLSALIQVSIVECENLEAIVAEEDEEEKCRLKLGGGGGGGIIVILFPQLTSLYLRGLPNLLTITPKPYTFNRSSLDVIGCDKLQDIHR
ncbi:hypothetical protein LguiB_027001 [Lonicera macranthoides]